MSKAIWQKIKNSKRFYVRSYRKLGSILLGSVFINVLLGLSVTYEFLTMPEPDFYATYGEIPPIKLFEMNSPNYSSTPLLPDDRQYESDNRKIPS